MEEAVHTAIRQLEEDSPIKGYMLAKEAEVYRLCITEYDEKKDRELFRKDCLAEGVEEESERMNSLIIMLEKAGRADDVFKAAKDPEFKKKLYKEFGIA